MELLNGLVKMVYVRFGKCIRVNWYSSKSGIDASPFVELCDAFSSTQEMLGDKIDCVTYGKNLVVYMQEKESLLFDAGKNKSFELFIQGSGAKAGVNGNLAEILKDGCKVKLGYVPFQVPSQKFRCSVSPDNDKNRLDGFMDSLKKSAPVFFKKIQSNIFCMGLFDSSIQLDLAKRYLTNVVSALFSKYGEELLQEKSLIHESMMEAELSFANEWLSRQMQKRGF